MKRFTGHLVVLSILCLLPFAQNARATLVEGFEGSPPSSTGDGSIQGTYQGVVPPEGSHQYLITTINAAGQDGTDGYSNQSGTNAVINSALGSFYGVNGGLTLAGTEGSGFKLSIVVPSGFDTISFQYDFLTDEFPVGDGGHGDFAFALLLDSSNNLVGGVQGIATPASIDETDANRQLPVGPIATNPFTFDTGYQTFTITGLAPGTYTLGIGIEDKTTTDGPSGLLVDNISVVPEPSTIAFCLAGAGLLGALRTRFKRKS
jgi:hypothetical protein